MKAKKINTYIFDLDDTLYEEIQFVKAGMMSVCLYVSKKYGLECKELFDYCMELLEKEGRGKIFDNLCAKYELDEKVSELVKIYRGTEPNLSLYEDAEECLLELKKQGFKLGDITDGNAKVQGAKVRGLGLNKLVDAVLLTDEMRRDDGSSFSKPAAEVYEECLKMLGAKPDESVYVGDNPNKDFIGARKLGMGTVHIVRDRGMFVGAKVSEEYEADKKIHSLKELI